MGVTGSAVENAMDNVVKSVDALKAVAIFVKSAVDEQARSTTAINQSIEGTAKVARTILDDMKEMSHSANMTGETARTADSIAAEMAAAALAMQSQMDRFKQAMKAA